MLGIVIFIAGIISLMVYLFRKHNFLKKYGEVTDNDIRVKATELVGERIALDDDMSYLILNKIKKQKWYSIFYCAVVLVAAIVVIMNFQKDKSLNKNLFKLIVFVIVAVSMVVANIKTKKAVLLDNAYYIQSVAVNFQKSMYNCKLVAYVKKDCEVEKEVYFPVTLIGNNPIPGDMVEIVFCDQTTYIINR